MITRRGFVSAAAATAASSVIAGGRALGAMPEPVRYPDPNVVILDPRFARYRLSNAAIERIHTGMRWAEGPAWNGVGRYLVWSDIASNEQLRWIEESERVSRRFRSPSNNANGNTFDLEGRQVTCEHLTRRVVRYEHDGSVSILADRYNGKGLNAPNDVVVHPEDGSIWFTDPGYGAFSAYEGEVLDTGSPQPVQKEAVYRIDAQTGAVTVATDEPYKPNGLCFSPDARLLYVAETGGSHYKQAANQIWAFDVRDGKLSKGRAFASMTLDGVAGGTDGIRCDADGNVWSAAGWGGAGYDGVHVFAPNGDRIGQIKLPEVCANLAFGGTRRNRLFMTASQSLYSLYVGITGAPFG